MQQHKACDIQAVLESRYTLDLKDNCEKFGCCSLT